MGICKSCCCPGDNLPNDDSTSGEYGRLINDRSYEDPCSGGTQDARSDPHNLGAKVHDGHGGVKSSPSAHRQMDDEALVQVFMSMSNEVLDVGMTGSAANQWLEPAYVHSRATLYETRLEGVAPAIWKKYEAAFNLQGAAVQESVVAEMAPNNEHCQIDQDAALSNDNLSSSNSSNSFVLTDAFRLLATLSNPDESPEEDEARYDLEASLSPAASNNNIEVTSSE